MLRTNRCCGSLLWFYRQPTRMPCLTMGQEGVKVRLYFQAVHACTLQTGTMLPIVLLTRVGCF